MNINKVKKRESTEVSGVNYNDCEENGTELKKRQSKQTQIQMGVREYKKRVTKEIPVRLFV